MKETNDKKTETVTSRIKAFYTLKELVKWLEHDTNGKRQGCHSCQTSVTVPKRGKNT
jgi:hypothetical protein